MRTVEIVERLAVLSDNGSGTTIELNRVAFDGRPAKLDVRRWKNGIPKRGISLTDGEAVLLLMALRKTFERGVASNGKEESNGN